MVKKRTIKDVEKEAEVEHRLDKISPEVEIPFDATGIKNFQASWEEGDTRKVINEKPMQIISFETKKNPNLIKMFNFNHTAFYFDVEKGEIFLYVYSPDRKRILRKVRVENHDILNLYAFCLHTLYPDMKLKHGLDRYVSRKTRKKIAEFRRREAHHYGNEKVI